MLCLIYHGDCEPDGDSVTLTQSVKYAGSRRAGFTMIELMVTLAVIAILAGFSAPYFRDIMLANQITGYSNDLVAASYAARIEAIKRTVPIRISALDSSSATNEWGPGLVIYLDVDGNSAFNAGDEEIRTLPAVHGKHTIDGPDGVTGFNFQPSGTIDTADVQFQFCDSRTDEAGRAVTITRFGQVRAEDYSCS